MRRAYYDNEDADAHSVERWRENLQEQGVRCGEVWLALLAHVKVDMELEGLELPRAGSCSEWNVWPVGCIDNYTVLLSYLLVCDYIYPALSVFQLPMFSCQKVAIVRYFDITSSNVQANEVKISIGLFLKASVMLFVTLTWILRGGFKSALHPASECYPECPTSATLSVPRKRASLFIERESSAWP